MGGCKKNLRERGAGRPERVNSGAFCSIAVPT
jgi:hypothetical protein